MVQSARQSALFLVRTWIEAQGENHDVLRGMVRDLRSGETRYFGSWESLVAFVDSHVALAEASPAVLDFPGFTTAEVVTGQVDPKAEERRDEPPAEPTI